MALKAVHVSEIPNLDQVPENLAMCYTSFADNTKRFPKFMVIGHRGSGMNMLQSADERMKSIKENSILSFNAAAKLPLDFIEFDVQVTKDDCPIIFHDNFILSQHKDSIMERRVTDLTLAEFLSYGPQENPANAGKPLFRKTKDGRIFEWKVEKDDHVCTLLEVFQKVDRSVGFNVELKFDDSILYKEEQLTHILHQILRVVYENVKERPIIFSSFQPDAALLMRKLQNTYPVFFLTNGGTEIYMDVRRNSLEEATKLCLDGGLQGIVCEVRSIFRNPTAVVTIKDSNLSLITYGQMNNVPEVAYAQHRMGIEGVIVDLVHEITAKVSNFDGEEQEKGIPEPKKISKDEISFMLKLVPGLCI
ncbi:glycerophosphodiester phosphodiesterase GDPD1, chloroplastic-like [Rutidosis leptorrhynchoides]|uniref:glycerophosphodiester phosphodiesterase GDPD1, chloroplastic-like n=1 Tax=Rutidosis leptorrhynchoides TaxID=125765 RepID=UPI003A998D51